MSMTELKGPLQFLIKKYIVDKSIVELKLLNNDILSGRIVWADNNAIHIEQGDQRQMTIFLNSIAYLYERG